jgi:hypothetical protein
VVGRIARHLPENLQGAGEAHAFDHVLRIVEGVGGVGVVEEHPAGLWLHRSAPVDVRVQVSRPLDVDAAAEVLGRDLGRAVQHDSEGPFGIVVHEQDHGAPEVRIEKLRHRHEQRGGQGPTRHTTRVAGERCCTWDYRPTE